MRICSIIILSLLIFSTAFSQPEKKCLYRVSFAKWQWDVCSIKHSMLVYLKGKQIKDSAYIRLETNPDSFSLKYGTLSVSDSTELVVTSADNKTSCEIKSFEIISICQRCDPVYFKCNGTYINKEATLVLNNEKLNAYFLLRKIIIVDPKTNEEQTLPPIFIYITE